MRNPEIPDGLLCGDDRAALAKTELFQRAGAGLLHLVLDFDCTLTISRPGSNEDVTTWRILNDHLPEHAQGVYHELFARYRVLEKNGTLQEDQAITWWSSMLDLFVEHRLDVADVERGFLSKATIRPGTKELFELCARHGIPTIILSAGIRDVIELWARAYDIQPTIILSTSLELDAQRRVCGWNKSSLVHTLNKKEIGHPELTRIRDTRRHAILIGDSLTDADMAEGTDGVFRIRIHDPRADEARDQQIIRKQTFTLFDAMIESGSLQPVEQLVQQIVR